MKNLLLLTLLSFMICACSTQQKMLNKAFYYGVIGQKEKDVYSRVGLPSETYDTEDGEKVLVYKVPEMIMNGYSKNIEPGVTPSYNARGKRVYDVNIAKVGNAHVDAQKYSEYGSHMTYLNIYLDEKGICKRIDQDLPKPQAEYYNDRLEKYIPEDQK